MNAAEIAALVPALVALIGALIAWLRAETANKQATIAKGVAQSANRTINAHVYTSPNAPTSDENSSEKSSGIS
jgi:hypothetical protein